MKKDKITETKASALSGFAAGMVFLILLFLAQWNLFVDILLSAGLFAGGYLLLKPRERIGSVYVAGLPDAEELKKYLEDGRKDFRMLEACTGKIRDPKVKGEADHLNQTAGKILDFLEEHPQKIRLARQFIDYYQNTASSLLQKYVALQDTNLGTNEVQRLKKDTANAMHTLNVVFEEQFQKLLRNEMMDMDAEIRLLEQTVKYENISEKMENDEV